MSQSHCSPVVAFSERQSNRLQNRFDLIQIICYMKFMFVNICKIGLLVLVLQPKQMANTVRRYKISVTMVCSMNKNNIRNGQEKSKRRIVRFKSKICEIKNISSEIQIIPFVQYVAKFVQKHARLAVIGRNMG